ncbi:heme iron utilization protein [Azospirillaceae bacterium]
MFMGSNDSFGEKVRRMMRSTDRAALATLERPLVEKKTARQDGEASAELNGGWPMATLAMVAFDYDASPLLLISELAEHTRNLRVDDRVGLLFDGSLGMDEPLAGARASVLGRVRRSQEPHHFARFVSRHPGASSYGSFGDFAAYRIVVERVYWVAGFGAARWLSADQMLFAKVDARSFAEAERDVLLYMNNEHFGSVQLYATALLGLPARDAQGRGWIMTGIDPEGFDLRCGGRVARCSFDSLVSSAEQAQHEFTQLSKRARVLLHQEPQQRKQL